MNEVENEDLVFTLETIVDKFGEEMAPYALGLCQNLVCQPFFSFSFISACDFLSKTCSYYFDRLLPSGNAWLVQKLMMKLMIPVLWRLLDVCVP
jgi:hypothetical protein